jgi:hypothetical protein
VWNANGTKVLVLDAEIATTGDDDYHWIVAPESARVHIWSVPPSVPDEPERIRTWVSVRTGQDFDEQGVLRTLSFDELQVRRKRLKELGGPPIPWRKPKP